MKFFSLTRFSLALSAVLVIASAVAMVHPGPKLSIEFTGGTLLELRLPEENTPDDLKASLEGYDAEMANQSVVSATTTNTVLLRTPTLTNEQHLDLIDHLSAEFTSVEELQFTTIGPTVGSSLKRRSVTALVLASIAIVLYLTFVFRKIPAKLSAWRFGLAAIVAVVHDVMIIVGIFSILSHVTSFQMDTLFVTALLSIMGYSVNDTIVIFDRLRDNITKEGHRSDLKALATTSLRQSIRRTVNTSVSTIIVLLALLFLGAESIRWFTLTLIVGAIVGTYSSFFVAPPLVVYWQGEKKTGKKKKK